MFFTANSDCEYKQVDNLAARCQRSLGIPWQEVKHLPDHPVRLHLVIFVDVSFC